MVNAVNREGMDSMKSAVLVIAQHVFRDEEYAEPLAVLERRGVRPVTASRTAGEAVGKLGLRVDAGMSLADAADHEWDAAVFIGGAGAAEYFDDPSAHRLARETLERGGVVGAICIAPSVLARAGLLDGVRATAFPSQQEDVTAHGARWTGDDVTVDGRIVTANGPGAATAFGEALGDLMGLESGEDAS